MKIPYEQLTPSRALEVYCDWTVEQLKSFKPPFEWYFLFYPIRTLLLGAKLLNKEEYAEAVWPWLDQYCIEQFPNGALSSTCRGKAITEYSKEEIEDYIRNGKLNSPRRRYPYSHFEIQRNGYVRLRGYCSI